MFKEILHYSWLLWYQLLKFNLVWMWEHKSPSRFALWKQILCCYQHQKQHVWYIVLDTQQSFPVFSFSSKNSRIPFSLGHCHSQYVYYNIYLSIIRNCRLIINEINSPNFVNQLPLSRYTPIYLWQSHIKITCNGFIQKYFLTGKTLLFFILSW